MPLYLYECDDCKHMFEIMASLREVFSGTYGVSCPACGSGLNRRLVSRTSFSLKGNGWYKDGYSSKNMKNKE